MSPGPSDWKIVRDPEKLRRTSYRALFAWRDGDTAYFIGESRGGNLARMAVPFQVLRELFASWAPSKD